MPLSTMHSRSSLDVCHDNKTVDDTHCKKEAVGWQCMLAQSDQYGPNNCLLVLLAFLVCLMEEGGRAIEATGKS